MAVIIFLIYRTTTSSTLSTTICMSKVIDWCTRCKLKGTAVWTCNSCCNSNDPSKCSCLSSGPDYEWVQKCIVTIGPNLMFNFDKEAAYQLYELQPWKYCQRVGVS